MTDHRGIHAPLEQRGMVRHAERPGCYTSTDNGHACACAFTPEQQQDLLAHTPGCELCVSGQMAAALYYLGGGS